ncbi:MAG: hypothetical protein IAF02_27055 [Anaerolineae bacterium]|nr:hypothetical protein [Anaerolineae bacterium]
MMAQHKLTMYETAVYRIRFQGAFDEYWLQDLGADWTIQFNDESTQVTTTITGVMCDQAALMGLLSSLYNVGLPLLGVECLETLAGQSCRSEQQTE